MINKNDKRYAEYKNKFDKLVDELDAAEEKSKQSKSMFDGGNNKPYFDTIVKIKALKQEYSFLFKED